MDLLAKHPRCTIFFVGLLVRLAFNVLYIGHDYEPVGDAFDYVVIAENVLAGRGYAALFPDGTVRPTARRPPLFPLFLAGCFSLFGKNFLVTRVILSVIGSVTCVFLYVLAQRLFDQRTAMVAGLTATVLPGLWINDTVLMTESLYVFLLLPLVTLADRDLWGTGRAVAAGLLAGLLALTRPEGILIWGLLAAWVVVVRPNSPAKTLFITIIVAAAVISPWVVRNYRQFGQLIPTATSIGQVLAGANHPETYYGDSHGGLTLQPVDPNASAEYRAWLADPQMNESDIDRRLRDRGLRYAREHMGRLPYVVLWRLRNALDLRSPLVTIHQSAAEGRKPVATLLAAGTFLPLLLVAIPGAVRARARWRQLFWPYSIIVFYIIDIAITWGTPRFRSPMEPMILLFAASCISTLLRVQHKSVHAERRMSGGSGASSSFPASATRAQSVRPARVTPPRGQRLFAPRRAAQHQDQGAVARTTRRPRAAPLLPCLRIEPTCSLAK